jgi:DNA invertase Pin-like site-specific DNA recombinase
MRLIGYLRVSTQSQVEGGLGLEVQRQAIAEFCVKHQHSVHFLADEGVSGTVPLQEREALTDALRMVRAGDANGLIVHRLDRLARLLVVQEAALAAFWASDAVVFEAGAGEIRRDDPEDPYRTALRQITGVVSELERRTVVARMASGRRLKRDRGGYVGGAPRLGLRAEEGVLVPAPAEAETIGRIAALRSAGLSWRAVIRVLEAEGRKPKRGGSWHPEVARRALKTKLQEEVDSTLQHVSPRVGPSVVG